MYKPHIFPLHDPISIQPKHEPFFINKEIEPNKTMLTFHPTLKPWTPKISKTQIISNTLNENNQKNVTKIKRLVLTPENRTKLNPSSDREFYAFPRFVTHVDDNFISTLTRLYRERISPGSEILDLMSSWVSHLPKEVQYKRVVGHGLNAQELARNVRLDYFFVKDLNQDQNLELESCSLDAVLCTVSVQYLQQPEKVFAEVLRVLRPGGVFIVSFSNRMFYEKAITSWRDSTAYGRVQLVTQYFQCIEGFTKPEIVRDLPPGKDNVENNSPFRWFKGFFGFVSRSDPFYAVVAYKNYKPVYE